MNRRKHVASAFAFSLCAAFTAIETKAAPVPVALTQIGNPIWQLTDFHLFSAPAAMEEQLDALQRRGPSFARPVPLLPAHATRPNLKRP